MKAARERDGRLPGNAPRVVRLDVADLERVARIPMAFVAHTLLDLVGDDTQGRLVERSLPQPFRKDYDAHPDEGPLSWPRQWSLERWGFLGVQLDTELIAACAIAFDTPGVEMLECRDDLAVLWDIRVAPDRQGTGVGRLLFHAASDWAREHGCRELKVETQNTNPAACAFYRAMGCRLRAAHRGVYADHPEEIQLIWNLEL